MKENNDIFKSFDDPAKNSSSFGRSFLIPFLSGILGTALVISIVFGIPSIKNSILNTSAKTEETSAIPSSSSNTGTVQTVSLSNYSDTAIYSANKVYHQLLVLL